jgi:glucokinase
MAVIALDVGGTKIAGALFSNEGEPVEKMVDSIAGKEGKEVGRVILDQIHFLMKLAGSCFESVAAIGICVPGIYQPVKKTVWAPNIPEWDAYPLYDEIMETTEGCPPLWIDSDRSCYILGEVWKGNAKGSRDAIFLAVGTGIGAGILVDGKILQGANNIAGAVGWLALNRTHHPDYSKYGCFETHASGEGLARTAQKKIENKSAYQGILRSKKQLSGEDIFTAYADEDPIAKEVINDAIEFWGMGIANMISIFNPEKIILGGGVMDSAKSFLEQINIEAARWSQPLSFEKVSIKFTGLGTDAGLYGAAYLARNEGTGI